LQLASPFADASPVPARPLDRVDPRVKKVGANVLSKNTTTNTSYFSVDVHETPEALLEALLSDQTRVGETLFQKVLEEGVVYWSFMIGTTKSCDVILRMRVERQDRDEISIRVNSVKEEGEF
jgi:hypothetical protein